MCDTQCTSPTRRVSRVIISSTSSKEEPAGQRPAKCHICPANACRRSALTAPWCHSLPLLCQSIIQYPSQDWHTIATVILLSEGLVSSRQRAPPPLLGWQCPSVSGTITECNLDLISANREPAELFSFLPSVCFF